VANRLKVIFVIGHADFRWFIAFPVSIGNTIIEVGCHIGIFQALSLPVPSISMGLRLVFLYLIEGFHFSLGKRRAGAKGKKLLSLK